MSPNAVPPVALFVYNRPTHTRRTLDALARNIGAAQVDLYVFSDGPKRTEDESGVAEVRSLFNNEDRFHSVTLFAEDSNRGLAAAIIAGVSDVLDRHEMVIVLEDDIITSPQFLQFLTEALIFYRDHEAVWHISGWNYPIKACDGEYSAFLWRVMNCWGWATWKDRWALFERSPEETLRLFSPEQKWQFNLDGSHDFFSQVEKNARGRIRTWAVFWYVTIFLRGGLCVNPVHSLAVNIGFDGSGTNCGADDYFRGGHSTLHYPFKFPVEMAEDREWRGAVKKFYDETYPPKWKRGLARLKSIWNETVK
ncbi:glycosyltransferase [Accumulibacter sp.]|uniref:glycosyltransferase n=1 Tax=Accumulibacter sp. TaxID=2053492 RepID=UPI001AC4B6D4|nr:glycosyltransferase [Accumulibacter sp.]MBN8453807.1 glycosyltransferase [Accumulibacter sp.]MBO3706499.1 glycosyltransferase [Candidatus Accumulibacter conexus]